MTILCASKSIEKGKERNNNIFNTSYISYIYVNNSLISSIKNILFNETYLIYDILSIKRKDCVENRLKTINENLDLFLVVLSSLYFSYVTDKRIKKETSFINLNSKILQSIIGSHRTKPIIQFLIDYDFIQRDNHFIRGRKSYGYRFAPKWLILFMKNELKFTKKETKLNLLGQYIDKFENSDLILNCFNYLEFDAEKAQTIKTDYLNSLTRRKAAQKDKYYSFIIDSWVNKDFFIKKSLKVGRVFTLLSSTPKIFRGCLKIKVNGILEPLFNCDIKSCQPLLLYTFYPKKTEEAVKYKELVESGLFYKTIIDYLKIEYNEETKTIYKDLVWKWAFDKKVYYSHECIDSFFIANFPELRQILIKAKERISITERKPHSKVPIHLQKMESSVMVEELVIFCKTNNINYLTIHDSVLCRKSDTEKIIQFITQKFQEKFDLTPNFDVKEII